MKDGKLRSLLSPKQLLHIWPILRIVSILTLVLVSFNIAVEAYSINKAFVWVKDAVMSVTWDIPKQTVDHYRIEVAETDLLADPVITSLSYTYVKQNNLSYDLESNHSYIFRVQSVNPYGLLSDYSDSTALFIPTGSQIAKVLAEEQPIEFALSQNYPNPFNSNTTIHYQIPGTGEAIETTMVIYNVLGQKIRELVHSNALPGQYTIIWDGLDNNGNKVSSGHYIYLLTAGKYRMTKKMILLK